MRELWVVVVRRWGVGGDAERRRDNELLDEAGGEVRESGLLKWSVDDCVDGGAVLDKRAFVVGVFEGNADDLRDVGRELEEAEGLEEGLEGDVRAREGAAVERDADLGQSGEERGEVVGGDCFVAFLLESGGGGDGESEGLEKLRLESVEGVILVRADAWEGALAVESV